jgi:hypothetical protein
MKQIETGCKSIFRFDNVLRESVCDSLVNIMVQLKDPNKSPNLNVMPWDDNDTLNWTAIRNHYLYAKIESHVEVLTYIVSSCYDVQAYPHFIDMVMWKTGRLMPKHVDNVDSGDENYFQQRNFTAITYLNDDYIGGENYISSENGDYVNVPKKGSVIIMMSDITNAHGVNQITQGYRVTLPIWFTKNYEHAIPNFR